VVKVSRSICGRRLLPIAQICSLVLLHSFSQLHEGLQLLLLVGLKQFIVFHQLQVLYVECLS
jgi:hypothetical protein